MTMDGKSNDLTFLSFNVNSLFNKMDELQHLVLTSKSLPLKISVCETWCNAYEPDTLYSLEKYVLFRRNRRERICGGVDLYVLESAIAEYERISLVESENEDIWLLLQLKNRNRSLTLCSTNQPPNSYATEFTSKLEESIPSSPPMSNCS